MSTRIGRRATIKIAVIATMILLAVSPVWMGAIHAQNAPAVTLVARALLPAESYTEGPASGAALAAQSKTVNGIKVPFPSQPVSSFTAVAPGTGAYAGTWQFLSGAGFDTPPNSVDYQMRINLLSVDWRIPGNGGNVGGGVASPGDWRIFVDPRKSLPITNPDKNRTLTGGDFSLVGLVHTSNTSFWTGDVHSGALLNFTITTTNAQIQGKPVQLPNVAPGALEGIGLTPDSKTFVIAARDNNGVVIEQGQVSNGVASAVGNPLSYPLDIPDDSVRGWVMINLTQALVIEQDNGQNEQAQIKRVYLVDLSKVNNGAVTKILVADLLNIADPSALGTDPVFNAPANSYGLKDPFKFPYQEIDSIYPVKDNTLLIANNNLFPIGIGRVPGKPADTELIELQIAPLPNFKLQPIS